MSDVRSEVRGQGSGVTLDSCFGFSLLVSSSGSSVDFVGAQLRGRIRTGSKREANSFPSSDVSHPDARLLRLFFRVGGRVQDQLG